MHGELLLAKGIADQGIEALGEIFTYSCTGKSALGFGQNNHVATLCQEMRRQVVFWEIIFQF